MRKRLQGMLTLLLVLVVQIGFAQGNTVSGTVVDQEGLPLPGVNVIEKGTNNGVQTNFDGDYSINVAEGQTLVFSYVGFTSQEVIVGSSNIINVTMNVDRGSLEEVVVVAYGAQKRESIVGSVLSLDSEAIEKQQATSVTSALQGNAPGVNIVTTGGAPGTNPTIRIRGVGSINADAEPLIIVDGAPFNGNINTISQDQVESINVLKDASSTALYGSRGANGVIVITTKRGKYGSKPVLNVNSTIGISDNAVDFHNTVRAADYTRYAWEALRNANQFTAGQSPAAAGQAASDNIITELGYNPYDVASPIDANGNIVPGANLLWDTDWFDELTRPNGTRTEHGISYSGGGERSRFFASTNYLREEGNVKRTRFERIASRLNVDTDITDWLEVGANMAFTISNSNTPSQAGSGFQNTMQWVYTVPSIYPVYRRDVDGAFILDANGDRIFDYGNNPQPVNGNRPIFSGENAVGGLQFYDFKNNRFNTNLRGYAEIKFTDWLKFRSSISYENYIFDDYSYIHNQFGFAANVDGRVSQSRDISKTLNAIQALNFNKTFGEHTVNADAIFENYQFQFDEFGAQGVGFLPNVKVLNGSTTPEGVSGAISEERLTSYLGRVSYNYADKYFVEGSYRRDGSTRFSEEERWGDFYSVGGSWIVSREGFLENSDVITNLKLKASYGELGNNRGIGFFPYLATFDTGFNQLGNPGVLQGGVVDPNLTWEKTATLNVGTEFGLFDNTLTGSVEYYERESVDLIYDQPLPISTGNASIRTNVGSIKNSGIEVILNANIISKSDFNWTAGVNFSLDDNEITDLPVEEFLNGTKLWREGRSLFEFYTYEYAGVDPSDGYAMWYKDILDAEGEPTGERTTTKEYTEASRNYIDKSSLPDIIGGFNTSLQYKNWDLSALLNFSFGSYVLDSEYQSLMNSQESIGRQLHTDIANRWQQPGDITDVPLLINSNNDFNSTSDRFIFANDYVRLKSLNFGYSISDETLEKFGLQKLRLFMQGDNLFTWQSHEGIDPEQDLNGLTNSRSYQLKTISFGVNVQI